MIKKIKGFLYEAFQKVYNRYAVMVLPEYIAQYYYLLWEALRSVIEGETVHYIGKQPTLNAPTVVPLNSISWNEKVNNILAIDVSISPKRLITLCDKKLFYVQCSYFERFKNKRDILRKYGKVAKKVDVYPVAIHWWLIVFTKE